MKEDIHDDRQDSVRDICAVLERFGGAALADAPAADVARRWLEAGFDDPEEIEDWLRARCFDADRAQAIENAGITPEQAGIRTRAGSTDDEETIGYKLTRGDLSFEEARRIINDAFWNN